MSSREVVSLETLLRVYPDVSVSRQQDGYLTIGQDIPGLSSRVAIIMPIKHAELPLPFVNVALLNFPKSSTEPRDPRDTSFYVIPKDENSTVIEVYRRQLDIDIAEALEKIRQGFEIFDAFTRTPLADRVKFKNRVNDQFDPTFSYQGTLTSEQLERIRAQGMVYEDHNIDNDWRYTYWVLRKNVAEVKEHPAISQDAGTDN